jgi:hypothetical protein
MTQRRTLESDLMEELLSLPHDAAVSHLRKRLDEFAAQIRETASLKPKAPGLIDLYAGAALQGLLASRDATATVNEQALVRSAFSYAAKMMTERERVVPEPGKYDYAETAYDYEE